MKFSDTTCQMLVEAGWYPGRSVNVDAIVETLIVEGLPVFPALVDVFREFTGLTIAISDGRFQWPLRFDTEEDIGKTDRDHAYSHTTHEPVCVVGFSDSLAAALLVGESGRVYGARYGDPDDMWIIASSIYDAIESIVNLEPESGYKHLAPYNDDTVREILLKAQVIAIICCPLASQWHSQEAQEIAQLLREGGYRVYLIDPTLAESTDSVYTTLNQVPESIDIVVWDDYQTYLDMQDEIVGARPSAIFSLTHSSTTPAQEGRVYQDASIQVVPCIGIKRAYERIHLFPPDD